MEADFINVLLSAVATVGFPIVAFYLMYRMVNGCIKDNTEAIKENTKLMTEVLSLVTAIKRIREGETNGK